MPSANVRRRGMGDPEATVEFEADPVSSVCSPLRPEELEHDAGDVAGVEGLGADP
ncbi:MAG: hypothetical protein NT171_16245 [Planctomycetota bacterium]|nr:hypothetical protein [Planctomycetota bacterium]